MTARRVSPETRARRLKRDLDAAQKQVELHRNAFHDKDGQLNVAREAAIREKAARDPESVAIDGCIKALDALPAAVRGVTSYTQSSAPHYPDSTKVSRVLDYLQVRYIGPRPDVDYLTHELAKAYDRIRDLEQRFEAARSYIAA